METVLNLITNAENIRTLLLLALGCSGFVWIKTSLSKQIDDLKHNELAAIDKRIDGVEASMRELSVALNARIDGVEASMRELSVALNARIDGVEVSMRELSTVLNARIDGVKRDINDLKHNDFAHLNATIEALTYALEKNGSLKHEDKKFVDSRLARC